MRLAMLTEQKPIVEGAVLAQSLEVVAAPPRRWRVESIAGDPGSTGIRHARLVSDDARRDRKTLAIGVLTLARGWSNA